jgi:hypothetical protein
MLNIIIYLIILALLHAKLELMIEGKAAWALRLPCWRIDNYLTRFLLGKEITGYHVWLLVLFSLIFHAPFLFIDWSLKKEMLTLGLFYWYWIAEDFFWFIESKHYGLRSFKKGKIYWHKRWFGCLPVSYWWGMLIGTLFLFIGGLL